jgi:hypothetical protein
MGMYSLNWHIFQIKREVIAFSPNPELKEKSKDRIFNSLPRRLGSQTIRTDLTATKNLN